MRDRSSAVLLSEIRRFVEPGTHIMSDGLASYRNLPANGYFHDVVIHDNEFVDSFDPSVHTQNIEIRNRFHTPLSAYVFHFFDVLKHLSVKTGNGPFTTNHDKISL